VIIQRVWIYKSVRIDFQNRTSKLLS